MLHQSINPSNAIVKIEASLLSAFSFNFHFDKLCLCRVGWKLQKGGGERRLDLVPRLTRFLSQTNKQTNCPRASIRKETTLEYFPLFSSSSLFIPLSRLQVFPSNPSSLFLRLPSVSPSLSHTLFDKPSKHFFSINMRSTIAVASLVSLAGLVAAQSTYGRFPCTSEYSQRAKYTRFGY